jgi:hypothetical protein
MLLLQWHLAFHHLSRLHGQIAPSPEEEAALDRKVAGIFQRSRALLRRNTPPLPTMFDLKPPHANAAPDRAGAVITISDKNQQPTEIE